MTMREHLKNYILNTVTDVTELTWENFLLQFDNHYTRRSFIKVNAELIKDVLLELRDDFTAQEDLNSSFLSVSTLIMDVD